MMEQTVVLIKPDGVKRGLVGEIIQRFERMGLKIVAMKMVWADEATLRKHYNANDENYLRNLGTKTLSTYKQYGLDAKKDLGTQDTLELGKMVIKWLLDYVQSGPIVAMLLEGKHAVDNVRAIAGPTMPVNAPAGTIRGDLATDSAAYANREKRGVMNLVHVSGSVDEANFEKSIWFSPKEIHEYKRAEEYI
jgi:nucleoside-diphosphate kinase